MNMDTTRYSGEQTIMRKLKYAVAALALLLAACGSDTSDDKNGQGQSGTGNLQAVEDDKSTLESIVSLGESLSDAGSEFKEKLLQEYESLGLSALSEDLDGIADRLKAGAGDMAVKEAQTAVQESESKLKELAESLDFGSAEVANLVAQTRTILSVTSELLANPESREDMLEIAKNLYQVSKNLKKLSGMVQTSPLKLAWHNLPQVAKYLQHSDFDSIKKDVDSLAGKLEATAGAGISASEVADLEGLVAFLVVFAQVLDENLNSGQGGEFSDKFKPNLENIRTTLEETQPLLDEPDKNSALIVKKLRTVSQCLKELSEITLEFPDYFKFWPKM